MKKPLAHIHWLSSIVLFLFICLTPIGGLHAQDYVTGSFEGEVKDRVTGGPVVGATVRITNQDTGVPVAKQTDSAGRFRQGLLPPGDYTITISKQGYVAHSLQRSLPALRPTVVLPPVPLDPESVAVVPSTTPDVAAATPSPGPTPAPTAGPTSTQPTQIPAAGEQAGIREEISTNDARRGGTYPEKEVSTLPLGATTLTRTFDELGLLLPGVAPPPETLGSVAGPGVGAGVGSAGQFSVNGLRSRANNFTVDGSDNNDEDIGVRRQGFLALVPQPIESIREFQMITLLAPAQFGRNFGAQVNAISKSGGNDTHGAIYGFINSSQLNARNFFDTTSGNVVLPLFGGNNQPVLNCGNLPVATCVASTSSRQIRVLNQSGGEDSFTLGQAGFVLGGPLVPETSARPGRSLFYFISMEGHALNASKEVSFAVPTVAQRGLFGSGASGLTFTPFPDVFNIFPVNSPNFFFPTSIAGDQLFSFFPFPNNPNGVYGANTLTQTLPASGQSKILSGKIDGNFKIGGRQQFFTARNNFTQDWREIPATGGAIFSTLRPRVRTQNFSTFLNSELSGAALNQLRLSYGRTRLNFEDVPDRTGFLLPSSFGNPDEEALLVSQTLSQLLGTPINIAFSNPNEARFLLRAPVIGNFTLPNFSNFPTSVTPNTGPIIYRPDARTISDRLINITTENFLGALGPVGQVVIGGFSPVGVDVFNFPQRRVNNTYQLADTLTLRRGDHSFAFGADLRRIELNSELPRNARPLITVYGAPRLTGTPIVQGGVVTGFTNLRLGSGFISGVDLAAAGVTSGFFQTLSTRGDSSINLRYYQLDFFGQDEWRLRPNFSLSYGLRYEYNTPARELNRRIESTFNDPLLDLVPGLRRFVDGRARIFDPDRNNFAPRIGFAYSPFPSAERATVIRAGYGLFYDQILGAVVSQSRNVFPSFLTANFAGGGFNAFTNNANPFGIISNPFCPCIFRELGQLNAIGFLAGTTPQEAVAAIGAATGRGPRTFGATLPARELQMPLAHQYSVTVEHQLTDDMVLSAAYVGTQGRNLLRFTTPNLGPNELILPLATDALGLQPTIFGFTLQPGIRPGAGGTFTGGRPFNAGVVNVFETTATSRYDALQLQLRGRYRLLGSTQFQVNYTYGKATDDVSDVFDLAGASALPQNSLTFAGEDGPANFDVRHRVAYNYITDLSSWGKHNAFLRFLFDRTEIAGNGAFQTAQPFTVNSINDVNLDGNLTDRLNSTTGIVLTGDRSQPLRLTVDPATLLAPVGQDGQVPRNTFRAGNLWLTNAAVVKTIAFSEHTRLIFRAEAFNLFNRANFGIPVRFLESPGFGRATDTVTPARRIQFGLKLAF